MRLDAHQHFWSFNAEEYPWIRQDWPIRRDFLPHDLQPILARNGLDGCIAVQARQSLKETRWLLELAERHFFIKGVVGWVDLRSDSVREQLAEFAGHPRFAGVRHVVQDEPDNFMLGPEFLRGIGELADFDLAYDILVFPRQLPAAVELAKRFPQQRFVLDHLGKPGIKQGAVSPWNEQIGKLADCSNVHCKLSGLVTEANWHTWEKAEFEPFLEVIFESFGVNRLMFGSDWPVYLLAATYDQVFNLVQDRLASLPAGAQESILGGNAERFYLQRNRSCPR